MSKQRRVGTHFRTLGAIALVGLGPIACGQKSDAAESAPPARLVTFNVGLATGYEVYVAERKPAVESALAAKAKDADVLCVQEYWDESDWKDLVAATASELPYALRRPAEPGPVSCDKVQLDPLMACLSDKCAGKSGQDLVSCALTSCGSDVSALSSSCAGCVTQDLSLPLEQIYAKCTSGSQGNVNDTAALFGGVFDVGMVSRYPFVAQDSKRLDAFLVRVGVLYAKLKTPAGDLHVFCTHLTSDIGGWKYGGDHGSWHDESTFEAQQLLDYVNEKTKDGGPAVVLGDLNSSVAAANGIEADWPESLQLLTGAGFSDPFVEQADVSCSLCPDNPQRAPDSAPKLVDHVLLRDFAGKAEVARVFAEPVTIESQGKSVTSSLSDHYGLEATLRKGGAP